MGKGGTMALIKCPECGKNVSSTAEDCVYCGATITSEKSVSQGSEESIKLVNCKGCGKTTPATSENCIYCGAPIKAVNKKDNTPRDDHKEEVNNKPIIKEEPTIKEEYNLEETNDKDVYATWKFYIKWAKTIKIICFIFAGLACLSALILIINESYEDSSELIPVGLFMLVYGIFIEKDLKWKAYMLKSNYHIMNNKK